MFNKIQRAASNPRYTLEVLLHKVPYQLLDHKNYKRFIVLSRSRAGSNLLISYLNYHPNISSEYEIFQKVNGQNSSDILSNVFSKQPLYIRARGFKIFYYHPIDDEKREIWDLLVNMEDLHIIHLKRRNILRTLISRKLAEIQDIWVKTNSDNMSLDRPSSISFEKEELENSFKQTRMWENNGDFMFRHHPLVTVYYEDLVDDLKSTMSKIFDFFDLPYVQPKTFLRKQNPQSMRELVTNYELLKLSFEGTEWETFFEE